jgi:hypothetical protein
MKCSAWSFTSATNFGWSGSCGARSVIEGWGKFFPSYFFLGTKKEVFSPRRNKSFALTFDSPGARNMLPALSSLLHHLTAVLDCLYQYDFDKSKCARKSYHTLRRVFHFFLLFRHKPSAKSRPANPLIYRISKLSASVLVCLHIAQGDPPEANSE